MPRLLDLCCGAGGVAVGYHRAGFEVVGVDNVPQPRFPFEFHLGDALNVRPSVMRSFDVIHASPPCQPSSYMSACRPGLAARYAQLIPALRSLLESTGVPYVIENVPGAPLLDPVVLCGQMFGRELYRHRLFESSLPLVAPAHPEHRIPASRAGHWKPGTIISVAGHIAPIALARRVMEIDWMRREELAEAIPPYYTEYIGAQLLGALGLERAA
jgi:DNA (cytosine-5)-methyltransferase 1